MIDFRYILFTISSFIIPLTACMRKDSHIPDGKEYDSVIRAIIDSDISDTRTHLHGGHMTWHDGDAIKVTISTGMTSEVNPTLVEFTLSEGIGSSTGLFVSHDAIKGSTYSCAYPSERVSSSENHHYVIINFPSQQNYVQNGITDGTIPMWAVGTSPSNMKFNYGCGIIRLRMYSETPVKIRKIEVITNEPASGDFLAKPTVEKFPYAYFKTTSSHGIANTNTVITYNVPDIELKPSSYPPVEFNICLAESGFCEKVNGVSSYKSLEIKIYTSDGTIISKAKSNFVVQKGVIHDFPIIEYREPSGNETLENITISLKGDLIDTSRPDDLGLSSPEGLETISVFAPSSEYDMKFNNHPQFAIFKDRIYLTWVGHPRDEKSEESWAYYSWSSDGLNWEKPKRIGPDSVSSGGWITDGNYIGNLIVMTEGGIAVTKVLTSTDGLNWSEPRNLIENAQVGESVKRLPSGRYIVTCHGNGYIDGKKVRKTRIMYSDSQDGLSNWKEAYLPDVTYDVKYTTSGTQSVARPVESSWYRRSDGVLVALFRDLWFDATLRTWRILASVSYDNGLTWTAPVLTSIPDSDSMQCAGNLEDGRVYFVNNPVEQRRRVPLTLAMSKDGAFFDKLYLLRGLPPELRYEGGDKTKGYSYPGSISWKGYLYVAYATNKEDIEISKIPIENHNMSSSLGNFEIKKETWN